MSDSAAELPEIHSIGTKTREWMVDRTSCAVLAEAGIFLTGISSGRLGFEFQRVRPNFCQVLACFGGQGRVWLPDGWRSCKAGDVYITAAHRVHRYQAVAGRSFRIAWVMYLAGEGRTPRLSSTPLLMQADPRPLRDAVWGLYRETLGAKESAMLRRWVELVDAYGRRLLGPGLTEPSLWRLWEAVDADIARSWRLADLAKLSGSSEERLRTLCQARHGTSPMHYVTELRMQRAALLLRSTSDSIESIALSVGYKTAFAFSSAFRAMMGTPPSRYRDNNRQ